MNPAKTAFISGHLDLTVEEFQLYYKPTIDQHFAMGFEFVVGDARGADHLAQQYLFEIGAAAMVFHMFDSPRNNAGFPMKGGYTSDKERDEAMTAASAVDIAWVRPGREKSGTAKNLARRTQMS